MKQRRNMRKKRERSLGSEIKAQKLILETEKKHKNIKRAKSFSEKVHNDNITPVFKVLDCEEKIINDLLAFSIKFSLTNLQLMLINYKEIFNGKDLEIQKQEIDQKDFKNFAEEIECKIKTKGINKIETNTEKIDDVHLTNFIKKNKHNLNQYKKNKNIENSKTLANIIQFQTYLSIIKKCSDIQDYVSKNASLNFQKFESKVTETVIKIKNTNSFPNKDSEKIEKMYASFLTSNL